jgi:hypothetical protein
MDRGPVNSVRMSRTAVVRIDRAPSTEELGAKLSPEMREWVDRVIVPALLREYLAEKKAGNCLANPAGAMAQSQTTDRLSAEGVK